jgi:hypothetical protein
MGELVPIAASRQRLASPEYGYRGNARLDRRGSTYVNKYLKG